MAEASVPGAQENSIRSIEAAFERRVVRLDEMSDAEIEGMVAAEIPSELRYSVDDIPDAP